MNEYINLDEKNIEEEHICCAIGDPKHQCGVDKNWMNQLDEMEALKEGVGLRGYAQGNPLQVYALEGFQMFDNMMATISEEISRFLLNAEIRQNIEREEVKNIHLSDGKEQVKSKPKKSEKKIGRNDPCPCGSGKKYKQCCGK